MSATFCCDLGREQPLKRKKRQDDVSDLDYALVQRHPVATRFDKHYLPVT
jgi:hypothetical protein